MAKRSRDPERDNRIKKAVGFRIKRAREFLNISQEELCEAPLFREELGAKFDVRTLRRYENEELIPLKRIGLFADYFKVSRSDLMDLDLSDDEVVNLILAAHDGSSGNAVTLPSTQKAPDQSNTLKTGASEVLRPSNLSSITPLSEAILPPCGDLTLSQQFFQHDITFSNSHVLAILLEMSRKTDLLLRAHDKQFYDGERPIPIEPFEAFTDDEISTRITLLSDRLGMPNTNLDALIGFWRRELTRSPTVTRTRLLELAESASIWSYGSDSFLKDWRGAMEKRLCEAIPNLSCINRFPAPPSPEELEKTLELAPLFEDWPSRLQRHRDWVHIESPFPDIEPMSLDDTWVDVQVADPLEAVPLHDDLTGCMDIRYEERSWMAEPAEMILERLRGAAALIGAPGSGKTTLLKWIARQVIKRTDGRFLLPFYVPLRKYALNREEGRTILSFALRQCGVTHPTQVEKWTSTLSYLSGLEKRTVLLLLDGWDEVPARQREVLREEIRTLGHGFAFLITSRPSAYPRALPVERFYEIAELPPESIHRLAKKWFHNAEAPGGSDMLLRHLDHHPDLRRLARNPFLLTLMCGIFLIRMKGKGALNRGLPTSRTALYREAVERISVHHSRRYPNAPFDASSMEQVERLAIWLFTEAPEAPRYIFNDQDVRTCCGDDALLPSVLQPSRLISQWDPEGGTLHFIHTTFQEYLAARNMLRHPSARIKRVIEEHALDKTWQEILRFVASGEGELKDAFWRQMRKIAAHPDRFGLIPVRLAYLCAEVGAMDGGKSLLGIDLRDELWARICKGAEINFYVDAYAELDAQGYVQRVQSCRNATAELKARLLRTLKRVRHAESSKALVEAILSGDKNEMAAASFAAADTLDSASRKKLRESLFDPLIPVMGRRSAIRALGQARDYESIEPLVEIASNGREMANDAFYALSHIGGHNVCNILTGMLSQAPNHHAKIRVIEALGRMRHTTARNWLIQELALCMPDDPLVLDILEALSEKPISKDSRVIVSFLKQSDEQVRAAAAWALIESTEHQAAEALAQAARNDGSPTVRIAALGALRRQARPSDVDWLANRVQNRHLDDTERAYALEAILTVAARSCHNGDFNWISSLAAELAILALAESDGELPYAAATWGFLLGDRLAPHLLKVCAHAKHSLGVREAACVSLGKLRHHEAVDVLMNLMRKEPNVPGDEEIPQGAQAKRLASAAADAVANMDAAQLLHEPGLTAETALCRFSVRTGRLVFAHRIVDQNSSLTPPSTHRPG